MSSQVKKLDPFKTDPVILSKSEPELIDNPLAKKCLIATFFSVAQIVVFAFWFYKVYVGYDRWYRYHKLGLNLEEGEEIPLLPDTSIVNVGIPLFISAIFIEWIISLIMGQYENYRMADTVTSFSNGLLQQFVDMFTVVCGEYLGLKLITAIPYKWIYENYAITNSLEGNLIGFIVMLFGRDLGYYWFHRAAHQSAFMWAVHGVHHAPNEFNYSVNVCQGAIQRITSTVFYAPLALFCPPELYSLIFPMEKIFGFMTHTRLVKNAYFISYIFVTPSTHRVHHAGAPSKYIDKNYGEMLSIWDRIFGTHQDEEEEVVFGHVHPVDTWNPIGSQLKVWKDIWTKTKLCNSFIDKILCFLMPPGWNPETGGEYPLVDSTPYSALKYDSNLPWIMTFYLFAWFLPVLGFGIMIVNFYNLLSISMLSIYTMYNVFCLYSLGLISDRNPNSIVYEIIRLTSMPFFFYYCPRNLHLSADTIFNVSIALGLLGFVSVCIVLSNSFIFIKESKEEWNKRVWIREKGRKFTKQLEKAK